MGKWIIEVGEQPGQYKWVKIDGEGRVTVGPHSGDLAIAATNIATEPFWVLLPSKEILLYKVELPAKHHKQRRAMLPYVLEEQLAESIEKLHISLGQHLGENSYLAAVVSHKKMQEWLQPFYDHDLRPQVLLPKSLAIVNEKNHWQIVQEGDEVSVFHQLYDNFSCDSDWLLPALEDEWLGVDETEAKVTVELYGVSDSTLTTLQKNHPFDFSARAFEGDPLCFYAESLVASCPVNLSNKQYVFKESIKDLKVFWRPVVVLAAAWVAVSVLTTSVQYYSLSAKHDTLQAEIDALYKQTFPDDRRIVNAKVQMENHLRALKSAGSAGEFLPLFSRIGEMIKGSETIRLVSTRFSQLNGELEAEFEIKSYQVLEQFRSELEKVYQVDVRSANKSQDDWVRASIRVKERKPA